MPSLSRLAAALLAALLLSNFAAAGDLARLRQELARETDPADRAKITVKIGEELLKQVAEKYGAGAYEEGDRSLTEYMEAVRAAHQGLRRSGRDARRRPGGFKHLEIHLRKSGRKLQDMAHLLPFTNRETLDKAREETEAIRTELLRALMKVDAKPRSDI